MSVEIAPRIEDHPPIASTRGLRFRRVFTHPPTHPFDTVVWDRRDAVIRNERGEPVFEQTGVEVPELWSATATNVVASKYFRGGLGSPERETSVRQLISRVTSALTDWGRETGFFAGEDDAASFEAELAHLLLHQMASFNSPVWFNVGTVPKPQLSKPQCSACFILSVEDDMGAILDLAKTEGMLFKRGSGAGSNLSSLRSAREALSGGGTASGPVSFMKGLDAFAGVIKSGGTTRRAAKMVVLDADHPDVVEFIDCKAEEEKKARLLIDHGYDARFDVAGGAYASVGYQNANHSVRVDDAFMTAVVEDREWTTHAVVDGRPMDTHKARELLIRMAEAAWACGDPGLQFDTTINTWHTCPASGRIRASNPCSEYMFLDDTACNLASINLLRFHRPEGGFDVDGFRQACEVMLAAQELIVDFAGYPTPRIAANSHRYRPLGLGYANLGALLMARGLPYDSAAGRALAAAITALMTGSAYLQSARMAAALGPFEGFEPNREPMLRVLNRHRAAAHNIDAEAPAEILGAALAAWDEALALGERHGLRNSQTTVLAPTGTIAFMMDCDTTGVEPDVALVKYKSLVGGGRIKIVNRTVPLALAALGYDDAAASRILAHVETHDTIEGAPDLDPAHLPVFDCAFQPLGGERSIAVAGHLLMLAATQPFISGAISKTINMPPATTAQEIAEAFVEAWRLGLKAVAVYRDGCKGSQPLSTSAETDTTGAKTQRPAARRRLPAERRAITHKFSVGEHEGYVTVGLYEDGQPGEIFLVMAKEGSTISGLMDAFATSVSIALQYGVPIKTLIEKFAHTRFEPSGFTRNPQIPMAKSVTDYIFRWLASKFLDPAEQEALGVLPRGEASAGSALPVSAAPAAVFLNQQDAPSCHVCGLIMVRAGNCYKCLNCGTTSGCG